MAWSTCAATRFRRSALAPPARRPSQGQRLEDLAIFSQACSYHLTTGPSRPRRASANNAPVTPSRSAAVLCVTSPPPYRCASAGHSGPVVSPLSHEVRAHAKAPSRDSASGHACLDGRGHRRGLLPGATVVSDLRMVWNTSLCMPLQLSGRALGLQAPGRRVAARCGGSLALGSPPSSKFSFAHLQPFREHQ